MKLIVNISRIISESCLLRTARMSKLCGSFEMDVTDGCYSFPFNIGQYIRLTECSEPILLDGGTQIIFDSVSKSWNVVLPTWYLSMFDTIVPKLQKEYGFDKIVVM